VRKIGHGFSIPSKNLIKGFSAVVSKQLVKILLKTSIAFFCVRPLSTIFQLEFRHRTWGGEAQYSTLANSGPVKFDGTFTLILAFRPPTLTSLQHPNQTIACFVNYRIIVPIRKPES
jgi:hypothetical protein